MLTILTIAMFIVPGLFSTVIHDYLRHGETGSKKKVILFVAYMCIINAISFSLSYLRGVKGFRFSDMTLSYRLKYISLGMVLGFVVPFIVCLLTEDVITIGGFIRYGKKTCRDLCKYMAYAIWSAKASLGAEVASSFLNWLWWLIEPFCMMLIYTVIFGYVFKAKEDFFPIFIFTGITMWGFFSRSINGSVDTVRNGKDIITKVYMPKYILLLSKMFVNGFKMLVSFGVIAIMMIVFRVPLSINIIFAPIILLVFFIFTFGIGSIMMHYGVYVNDLGYITGIVLQMLMYLSGVFYSISKRFPEPFGEIVESFNPVALFMSSMRDAILYGQMPPMGLIGIWALISLILAALGIFTVYSNENSYVKVI
ncbi:ABC transporter permease [Butyrivibrio sp.]|uniref:ABC transporter permease n=1 Tax=Butyrivibrio sp. TaxID=28121 RepID=UPI0025D352F5|nr:ABC transporter permease [Butyrivibrio sp.]